MYYLKFTQKWARAAMMLLVAVLCSAGARAQLTLTVNDGTATSSKIPVNGLYVDTQGTTSEFIIPAETEGMSDMVGGTITKLTFYVSGTPETWGAPTIQLYIGEEEGITTLGSISGPTNYTVVSTSVWDNTQTTIEVEFDVPFTYEGGNLLIGTYVQTNSSTYKSTNFYGVTAESGAARYNNGSGVGTAANFLPKTTFTYEPASTGCDMPTAITVSNITRNGATITWEGEGSTWNLRYKASTDANYTVVEGLTNKSYTLNNLDDNTTYGVGVQTDCGSGLTSAFRSTSFTTANPCAVPTNLVITEITSSSAILGWTPGYEETVWKVKYKKSSDSEWTEVTVNDTPTLSLTGLNGLTTYNVQVYNCTDENDPYLSVNFTTSASFPYSQDFSGSGIPTGWTQYSGLLSDVMGGTALSSSSYGWSNGTSNGVLDDNNIYANIYGTSCKKWIVTPGIPMVSGARLAFDVAYTAYSGTAVTPQTTGTDDKFVVLISTDNMATWTILRQWDNAGSEYVLNDLTPATQTVTFDMAAYAGQTVNVAFYAESTVSNTDNNIHIDNVAFELIPSCEKPTNLSVVPTDLDATFTWSSDASSFDVAYSMDNTANPDDVIAGTVNTPSYNFTNLDLGDHYVWVRANCSSTEHSVWVGPVSFHIGHCVPAPTSVDNNGITNVTFGVGDAIVNNDTPKATYTDFTAQIGAVQAGVESTIAITFETGYTYNTYVWVDLDNSLTFEPEEVVAYGESSSENPTTLTLNFTIPASQTTGEYRLRIGGADSGLGSDPAAANPCYTGTYACFQDYTLRVLEAPTCLTPTGLTAGTPGGHSVVLSWTSEASAWQICVNGDETNPINVTENPYTLGDLYPETGYTVKVRANCGDADFSLWSSEISFTTDIACPAPTNVVASNVTSTSAEISWTGNDDATSYNLRYVSGYVGAFFDDFENGLDKWTLIVNAEGTGWQAFDATRFNGGSNYSGDYVAMARSYENENDITADNWMITPKITIGNAMTYWARNDGRSDHEYDETYDVCVSTSSNNPDDFVIVQTFTTTPDEWEQITIDLSTYAGQQGYVAFHHHDTAKDMLLIDDLSISGVESVPEWQMVTGVTSPYTLDGLTPETIYNVEVQAVNQDGYSTWVAGTFTTQPSCMAPTGLAINNIDKRSADLTWTANGGETAWQICLNGDEDHLINVTENASYSFSDLTPETEYSVKVRAYCDETDQSAWSSPVSFTTLVACPAPTGLAISNITKVSADASWTYEGDVELEYSVNPWKYYDNGVFATSMGAGGTLYWGIMLPAASLTAGVPLNKVALHTSYAGEATLNVYLGGDQPAGTPVATQAITMADDKDFMEIALDTPVEIDGTQNLWITFYQSGLSYPADCCVGPTDPNGRWVSFDGETWEDLADYNYDYTWMIRAGFGDCQMEWIPVNDVASPQTIDDLTPQTDYIVRLRAVCGGEDGESEWVTTTFTTVDACPVPTDVAVNNVGPNSATVTWTGYSDSYYVTLGQIETTGFTVDFDGQDIPAEWTNNSEQPWTFVANDNGYYIQSGNAGVNSSESTISATVDYEIDGTIEFDAECMGEGTGTAWDKCIFTIDGVEQFAYGANVSGWNHYTFDVAAGEHTFTWSYAKDSSVNPTGDYMAIDNVVISMNIITWADEAVEADEAEYTFDELTPETHYCVKVSPDCDVNKASETVYFTTLEAAEITFAKEGYGTYFNSAKDVVLPEGMKAYVVTAHESEQGATTGTPTYAKIADGDGDNNIVPAGTAVLLQVEASDEAQTILVGLDTPSAAAITETNFLHGSDIATTTTGGDKFYKLTYKNGEELGWYWGEEGGLAFTSGAHKAWLALPADGARFFGLPGFDVDNTTTAVNSIEDGKLKIEDDWYSVNGRKLDKQPTRKGVYLNNGRKVVIK